MSREHWDRIGRRSNGNLCFVYPHTYNNYQYRVIIGLSHFSLTGTVSTSPNLVRSATIKRKRSATIKRKRSATIKRKRSATIITRPSGSRFIAKFGEVDTVQVSEKYTKHRGNSIPVLSRPLGYPIKP